MFNADEEIWGVVKYNYIYMFIMLMVLLVMNYYWLLFLGRIAFFGLKGVVKNEYDDKNDTDHRFGDKSQNANDPLIVKPQEAKIVVKS